MPARTLQSSGRPARRLQNLGSVWFATIRELLVVFFFSSRRRHTRLVSDWSSDVCSSDLSLSGRIPMCPWRWTPCSPRPDVPETRPTRAPLERTCDQAPRSHRYPARQGHVPRGGEPVRDRKSGVEGKRVNFGGGRINKKKK